MFIICCIGQVKSESWQGEGFGGTCKIEWLRLYDIPHGDTLHLQNPLNEYRPIKISRDGQELPRDIGVSGRDTTQ